MSQETPTRRQFLQGAAVTAAGFVAGCSNDGIKPAPTPKPAPAPAPTPRQANELIELLSKYEFTGNDGSDVNMAGLQAALGNNNIAVSYGFQRCKGVCPFVNDSLAELGRQVSNLKYIVVSTDARDNETQDARDAFMQELVNRGLARENITILYPKDRTLQDDLQLEMGAISAVPNGPAHTSFIFLYNADGKQIAKTSGKGEGAEQVVQELLKLAGDKLTAPQLGAAR